MKGVDPVSLLPIVDSPAVREDELGPLPDTLMDWTEDALEALADALSKPDEGIV